MTVANDDPLRRVVSETKIFRKSEKRLDENKQGYIIDDVIKRETKKQTKKELFKKPLDEVKTADIMKA